MVPWNAPRAKVQIRLSIQRLRTLQEKKLALAKKSRREIADLLLKGRVETAKLRVETIIAEDIHVELLELLELYSEKLFARFNLLEASTGTEPEESIADAVSALIYAAPRTEIKELQLLRELLMQKFGRTFSLPFIAATPPESVPPRVVSKLALFTPPKELVDGYLLEIANAYGVAWRPDAVGEAATPFELEEGQEEAKPSAQEATKAVDAGSIKPEVASTAPAEYPAGEESNAWNDKPPVDEPKPPAALSPEEALAARFEALKRK